MSRSFKIGIYATIIFSSAAFCANNPLWIAEEEAIIVSDRTKAILYRLYIISRLQKTIALLRKTCLTVEVDYTFLKSMCFSFVTAEVAKVCTEIYAKKDLAPLWDFWNEIYSYNHLNNQLCINEFSQLLRIIMFQVLGQLQNKSILQSVEYPIFSGDISYRFYIIKRLQEPLKKLQDYYYNQPFITLYTVPVFSHERVLESVHALQEEASLTLFFELAQEFQEFRYCSDALFIREFIILVLCLYKTIISESSMRLEFSFEDLSVENLLDAIDIMTAELSRRLPSLAHHKSISWIYSLPIFIIFSASTINLALSLMYRGAV